MPRVLTELKNRMNYLTLLTMTEKEIQQPTWISFDRTVYDEASLSIDSLWNSMISSYNSHNGI